MNDAIDRGIGLLNKMSPTRGIHAKDLKAVLKAMKEPEEKKEWSPLEDHPCNV